MEGVRVLLLGRDSEAMGGGPGKVVLKYGWWCPEDRCIPISDEL